MRILHAYLVAGGSGSVAMWTTKNDAKNDPAGGKHLMRFPSENAVHKFISKSVGGGSKSHDRGVTHIALLMRLCLHVNEN